MATEESGFTLIELLVCVAIIGILAAMAIPQYNDYKTRGFDARSISDLRNVLSAQEAQYVNTEAYQLDIGSLEGFDTASPSVTVILSATDDLWTGKTYHPMGSATFCYDSSNQEGFTRIEGLNQDCPWE